MNEQQTDDGASLNLPSPRGEQVYSANEAVDNEFSTESSQSAAVESGTSGSSAPFYPPPPQQPGDDNSIPATQPPAGVVSHHDLPPVADDVDLIEREWVHKAKEIVEQTQGDPYAQNKEISKVKADYIKKRYNKDVKIDN